MEILFQNGPIKEFGVNGITGEALAAIQIDRIHPKYRFHQYCHPVSI